MFEEYWHSWGRAALLIIVAAALAALWFLGDLDESVFAVRDGVRSFFPAALAAKSLNCQGCVVADHLTVPYAASAFKAGPAADLDCVGCVSEAEAAFNWAAAGAPGGVAAEDEGDFTLDVTLN